MARDEKLMEILEKATPDRYDGSVELQLDEAHDVIQKYYLGKLPEMIPVDSTITNISIDFRQGRNGAIADMHEAITGGEE